VLEQKQRNSFYATLPFFGFYICKRVLTIKNSIK